MKSNYLENKCVKTCAIFRERLYLLIKYFSLKKENRKRGRHSSCLVDPTNQTICFFCGEGGHTATNGPSNSKIFQYFSFE